jgi:hypothetical protein
MSTRVTKAELLEKLAEADRTNNLYDKTIDGLCDEVTMLREQLEAEVILREERDWTGWPAVFALIQAGYKLESVIEAIDSDNPAVLRFTPQKRRWRRG